MIEDVLVHHGRAERCGIVIVLGLGGRAVGEAKREEAGQCLREQGRPHDTSTVRNMPISM